MMTQVELLDLADGDRRMYSISKDWRQLLIRHHHEQEVVLGSREIAN